MQSAQRFSIKTYGCQMNAHDSQKVANLLLYAGMEATDDPEDADLLLINTCSIRDKAESRLYGDLGLMREWKDRRPGRVLGVGGCVAQQQGDALLRRFPQLDFVYGTHNLRLVPTLVAAAGSGQRASHTEETRSQERFDFPDRHPAYSGDCPGRAFVTVMEGCDMFCSFCIVPFTRGREISRPADAIVEEVRQGVAAGVREVTLLGQTVNAYGRHDLRRGSDGAGRSPGGRRRRRRCSSGCPACGCGPSWRATPGLGILVTSPTSPTICRGRSTSSRRPVSGSAPSQVSASVSSMSLNEGESPVRDSSARVRCPSSEKSLNPGTSRSPVNLSSMSDAA